jgi:hypothetical protein|tara:strand:- start:277 stop:666 length:390 start_codon:yes stop_codon:yes gene_type:complete
MAGTLKASITATTSGLFGTGGDELNLSFTSSVAVDTPVVTTGSISHTRGVYTTIPTPAKETYVYVRNTGATSVNDEVTVTLAGAAAMILTFDQWAFFPVKSGVAITIGNSAGSGSLSALADYAYFTESP